MDHQSDLSLPEYLRLARAKSATSNGVAGTKIHYYQFADLPRKLSAPGQTASVVMIRLFPNAKYIWLKRQDKARQAISLVIASKTNLWWDVSREESRAAAPAPEFDPKAVARMERVLERSDLNWQNFFQENEITPLVIHYEKLASDYSGTIATILKWLGVPGADAIVIPPPRLRRQWNGQNDDWLARYSEFKADGGASAEESDERDVLGGWVPRVLHTIPDVWKQWIAQSKVMRTSNDQVVRVLVGNGYSSDAALTAAKEAESDPYLMGAARMQQRMVKAVSLLNIQGQLARLDSRSGVVERRGSLSRAEFRDQYYADNRPVLIEGLMTEWRAMTAWTPEYLKSVAGDCTAEVMTGRDADPKYELNANRHRTEMRFADYVDMVYSGKVTNNYNMEPNNRFLQKPEARPLLQDFAAFPQYLRPVSKDRFCFLSFGPAGVITPLHHATRNVLLAQVAGRKRYRLIPASQSQYVYNNVGVFSDVDCERPDYTCFPRFRNATIIELVVQPGEVLFMPVGWWRQTRTLDVSMTISFADFVFPNHFKWER